MNSPTPIVRVKPLVISGEEAKLIRSGLKTQFRRVCGPGLAKDFDFLAGGSDDKPGDGNDIGLSWMQPVDDQGKRGRYQWLAYNLDYPDEGSLPIGTRFGNIGDLLWVKEPWRVGSWREIGGYIAVDCTGAPGRKMVADPDDLDGDRFNDLWIECCEELDRMGVKPDVEGIYHWNPGESPLHWRHARTMPRWASRLTLKITDFRIERLEEITQEDALSEGMQPLMPCGGPFIYERQWRATHFRKHHRWQDNPWVQAITYEVIRQPILEVLGVAT